MIILIILSTFVTFLCIYLMILNIRLGGIGKTPGMFQSYLGFEDLGHVILTLIISLTPFLNLLVIIYLVSMFNALTDRTGLFSKSLTKIIEDSCGYIGGRRK